MGEQTILCGVLQTASLLLFNKMVDDGIDKNYASKLIQNGWEIITEKLKHGGISKMMDMLSDSAKLEVSDISEKLKQIMTPLYQKHMDEIMSGEFSKKMMLDWDNDDNDLLRWREETGNTMFEKTEPSKPVVQEEAQKEATADFQEREKKVATEIATAPEQEATESSEEKKED